MSGARPRGSGRGRDVGGEHEPVFGPLCPSPQGDVVEEVPEREHRAVHHRRRHSVIPGDATAPVPCSVPDQEFLDVAALELGQACDSWMVLAEESSEGHEVVDETWTDERDSTAERACT